jgi:glycosyltransferase involved in cell wall biosynthesis
LKKTIPLVSVCVVTFNHKNYIKKCLEGILMQQTTFPFELVLGEDESDDGTRNICIKYAEKYPDKIKLFLRSRKDVIHINGKATGRYNFIESLKACQGKYIALCEGDDYWTDPLKLQKQVDFLEAHEDYAICFHKVKLLNPKGNLLDDFITKIPNNYENFETLLGARNFIHTPSVVFRNCINQLPSQFKLAPFGDQFLHLLVAKHGKLKFLEEVMGVYRYNVGVISKMSAKDIISANMIQYSVLMSYFNDKNSLNILLIRQKQVLAYYLNQIQSKTVMQRIKNKLSKLRASHKK